MSELIDREAVREFIKSYRHSTDVAFDMEKHLDEIPAASPWHRVEEELPEIGQIVLVYDDWHRLSICQLDNQYRWVRKGGGWIDVPYVRYWMPIEPPKED